MINWILGALLIVCLALACLASLLAFPFAVQELHELRTVETVDNRPCPCPCPCPPDQTPLGEQK